MKFNFKRISAIAASVLLTGMSVGVAAAANYPAPFVQGGVANVAVVYGTGSGVSNLDLIQAGNIQTNLQSAMGSDGGSGSGTVVTGDSVQIRKSTDEFNLGDNWNAFISTIDSEDLTSILADGTYKNDDNDEFDYEQEVVLGSAVLTHFTDNDFNNEEPVIGFDIADGTTILTYTFDFTPDNAESDDADWASFEGTTLEMLGKEYYILSASNDSAVLELLDSASDAVLNEGETITLESGENTYEASISFIGASSVKMVVNGETTPSLAEDETYKLDSGDYLGIKEINTQDYEGGIKQVEFSIGSGKIELLDGEEIEVNGEDVSDLDAYEGHTLTTSFTQTSAGHLDSFAITWALDTGASNEAWLAFDTDSTELVMPVFNNLKISLGNFVQGVGELTTVEPEADDSFSLTTELEDGEASFQILYADPTGAAFGGIGADDDERLVTNATANPTIAWDENSAYFVATWISGDDYESYLLEVTDIDDSNVADNTTTIESIASGKAIMLDIAEGDEIGEITFTLTTADETAGTAEIALSSSTGTVYADKVVTKEGMKIQLPHAAPTENSSATDGMINVTGITVQSAGAGGYANSTSWVMNFTEEDSDGNIDDGESFTVTLGFNVDETSVASVSLTDYETSENSDDYVGYVVSDIATKTMFYTGDDQDSIEIFYPGEESYAEVFLSEVSSEITVGTPVSASSTPLGQVLVMDSEVSSVSSKNLIIVGGSCINSAAATVLGGAYCGAAFTDATGIGSGQFLIQGFDGAYTAGKLALVVAGYEAADTVNAANYLQTKTVDTMKKYVGTSATSAEMVVESE
jgi:hypothetical protein